MTKQMEQPIRHRLRRCAGCGNAFVDPHEEVEFCAMCLAAGMANSSLRVVGGAPGPGTVEKAASSPELQQPQGRIIHDDSSSLGLPGKIAWTTPPFRVGWDEGAYLNESENACSAKAFPSENTPPNYRRRTLLALIAAVSVLMLISRLDAPDIEMVWRDLMKPKPAVEKHILPPAPQIGNDKPKIAN
jgi:hypothetical protein